MTEHLDSLMPADMAQTAEKVGIAKASMSTGRTVVLGILAGAFIALGAVFATVVTTESSLGFGPTKLLGGLAFSVGLILVIVAGAELFTGNNLIVMAWASRRVSLKALLRNWLLVYVGNFIGAVATAYLVIKSNHHELADGAVGDSAIAIASGKLQMGFVEAVAKGILANALVCLAVWMAMSARSVTDKVLVVIGPITAFVAAGLEHSIANMYFIPTALFLDADRSHPYWSSAAPSGDDNTLSWSGFVTDNLVPVTIGNIIGGAVLVAFVYWAVYGRGGPASDLPADP